MKTFPFLVSLLLLALVGPGARAQSDAPPKKVVLTVLADGRRKSTVTDHEKRQSEETITDNRGKLLSRTVYTLDETNQPHQATFYDPKGTVLLRAGYVRDPFGRVVEEAFQSPAGKPLGKRVYTYGAGNKVTRIDAYDPGGNLVVPAKPARAARPDKKKKR
ncbi:MAG: hypothetical protein M3463_13270 [Verrucomicrobiota bacterium]|nr:hypothetical protein [Verrucomicrobiota bacterium]